MKWDLKTKQEFAGDWNNNVFSQDLATKYGIEQKVVATYASRFRKDGIRDLRGNPIMERTRGPRP